MLVNHADPAVRSEAPRALAQWADRDHLRALIDDPDRGVRKAAMYGLGLLKRDESLAPSAWAATLRETGFGSTEALDAYVVHAPRAEAVARLETLAREDPRAEIRMRGVAKLKALDARAAIERLVTILVEPPHTNWSLHILLLDAIRELDLPAPDLTHLEGVDDLHLHAAVVQLRCR